MKPLHRHASVDDDLQRYWLEMARHNLDAADRFLLQVEAACRQIQRTPAIGRLRRWRDPRLHNIRSWRVPGFPRWLVFYRETPEAIDLIRVLHGMMDLDKQIASLNDPQ